MASVDYSKVPITEKALYVPPLEEVVDVLARGLPDTFETVSVSVVDAPDLTQEPFSLTSPGDVKLVEIGGPPYLVPLVKRDKIYDLHLLLQHLKRDPGFLAGAGAGPWPYLGVNCERPRFSGGHGGWALAVPGSQLRGILIAHLKRDPGFRAGAGAGPWPYLGVNCERPRLPGGRGGWALAVPRSQLRGTLIAHLKRDPGFLAGTGAGPWPYLGVNCERPRLPGGRGGWALAVPGSQLRGTLIAHLKRDPGFLAGAGAGPWPYLGVNCEGIINLSVRNGSVEQGTRIVSVEPVGAAKGSSGFLQQRLPNTETRTALLGNYLLSEGKPGKAKFHVMPDFSGTALCSDSDVDGWLHYFELSAPIVNVGTLVTGDLGLDLRVQHFHGFSAHGHGGHYHYDTTPDAAHYEGYFSLAHSVVRIDPPAETHALGRD
ncbi:Ester hydrolase C11orf54-like protein [Operophtera brumata]|uniref:Ester hydrolase C11orf54-like protein n=1 Tax=Operophtera brumata TaxID=104452 RepID=A0A0L7L9M9_OPEBR|nr:Ester hydrolase C11orf54-like protein [Operophtera brumata]